MVTVEAAAAVVTGVAVVIVVAVATTAAVVTGNCSGCDNWNSCINWNSCGDCSSCSHWKSNGWFFVTSDGSPNYDGSPNKSWFSPTGNGLHQQVMVFFNKFSLQVMIFPTSHDFCQQVIGFPNK